MKIEVAYCSGGMEYPRTMTLDHWGNYAPVVDNHGMYVIQADEAVYQFPVQSVLYIKEVRDEQMVAELRAAREEKAG